MMLIIILTIIAILIPIIRVRYDKRKYSWYYNSDEMLADHFLSTLAYSVFIALSFYFVSQPLLGMLAMTRQEVTYTQQLVSLKDGTGVSGDFYGGLFISRGQINDTQHFSYYRVVAPGQYALDKRDARQSTINTDATPDTARVDITDVVYGCDTTWYSTWCIKNPNEFARAVFHVPPESINRTYELDAQ